MRSQRGVSDGVKSELLLHVSLRHLTKRLSVVFQQLEDGGQLLTLHPGKTRIKGPMNQNIPFITCVESIIGIQSIKLKPVTNFFEALSGPSAALHRLHHVAEQRRSLRGLTSTPDSDLMTINACCSA